MAILRLMPNRDSSELVNNLKILDPDLDIRVWPSVGDKNDIKFTVVWNHPEGELLKFPNLKVIASYGAGIDHILKDRYFHENVNVTRFIDKNLIDEMKEFILSIILDHKLSLKDYFQDKAGKRWNPKRRNEGKNVGILGLGNLGSEVALNLKRIGFEIFGWSLTAKNIEGVNCYSGEDQLELLLPKVDYLICLLPLTNKTENILNYKLFSKMKKGAYLINAGRGHQLVEEDLIQALDENVLSGACLDVFREEPLAEDHIFWDHPKIFITPNIASITNPKSVAKQIFDNYKRFNRGEPLLNLVNLSHGY